MLRWLDTLVDVVALLMLVSGSFLLLLCSVVLFVVGLWPLGILFGLLFLGCCVGARDWMY